MKLFGKRDERYYALPESVLDDETLMVPLEVDVAEEFRREAREAEDRNRKAVRSARKAVKEARREAAREAAHAVQRQQQAMAARAIVDARAVAERVGREVEDRMGAPIARHERQLRDLERRVDKMSRRGGGGGSLLLLAAVAGGVFYLARKPQLRQKVLDKVEQYSPQARDWLHQAGQRSSKVVGSAWIEREEPAVREPTVTVQTARVVVPAEPAPAGVEPVRQAAQDVAHAGPDSPADVRIATREAEVRQSNDVRR